MLPPLVNAVVAVVISVSLSLEVFKYCVWGGGVLVGNYFNDFEGRSPFVYITGNACFSNRLQEMLCTKLLSEDNVKLSKCFLVMVKMWTKEIRYYFVSFI